MSLLFSEQTAGSLEPVRNNQRILSTSTLGGCLRCAEGLFILCARVHGTSASVQGVMAGHMTSGGRRLRCQTAPWTALGSGCAQTVCCSVQTLAQRLCDSPKEGSCISEALKCGDSSRTLPLSIPPHWSEGCSGIFLGLGHSVHSGKLESIS